ncbi:tetratricopeptide repeat protein [Brachyspira pilosicoli]|uniref:tetratricopeptide repeat protein n=1 Tax=Brachyspira pilosicoli TaxID=52584 RepID=UPI0012F48665|nr:tetratricopeptide repeat protein [Brachyspira pilosicoli]
MDNNTNNNTNDKPNNPKNNSKYKNNTCIMIILFVVALGVFAVIYFSHTKIIENRFNKALENYSLNIQTIMSNTTIDKTVITNESENSITINNEFIINDEIANSFKSIFDINTRMLESSMAEIMKNSNDLLSFWFAFLSVIMIVFTFAGIFINNNILSESKEKLADVNNKSNEIIENLKNKAQTESEQLIKSIKDKSEIESKQLIESIKKQAEEETKKLIEENNRNIKISNLFNSAYQAYNNKEYDKAINYYNQIIEMIDNLLKGYDENSEEYSKYKNNIYIAYYNRGNAKSNLGLHREAIEDFDKAIELNSSDFMAYNNRGTAEIKLKNYIESIKYFDKSIELNKNNDIAYNNRGTAKSNLGFNGEAIKDYSKAIELNPNYAQAYLNMVLPKQLLANNTKDEKEKNKLIEEAYNDFIKGYNLADDNLKEEYKQKAIIFAKQGYDIIIKICDKMDWEY